MILLPVSVPSCHWILTVPCLCCEAPIDSLPRGQYPGSVLQEGPNGTASPSSFTAPGLGCTQCRSGENDRVFHSASHFVTWAGAACAPHLRVLERRPHSLCLKFQWTQPKALMSWTEKRQVPSCPSTHPCPRHSHIIFTFPFLQQFHVCR